MTFSRCSTHDIFIDQRQMVYAGPIFWDAAKHGKAVMTTYRDFIATAPEELGFFVGLKTVPSVDAFPKEGWGKRACAIIGSYNGPQADGERAMAPLLKALPAPMFNWMGTMPFPAINSLFDPLFPKGLQWYWKADFVKSLPDEAIDTHIAQAAKAPTELCLMHLYPIDGAVRRVAADATAWSARNATFSMVIAGISPGRTEADQITIFGSVGLASQDVVVAWLTYQEALRRGVGHFVNFNPECK